MPIIGGFILGCILIAGMIMAVGLSAMAIMLWPITLALGLLLLVGLGGRNATGSALGGIGVVIAFLAGLIGVVLAIVILYQVGMYFLGDHALWVIPLLLILVAVASYSLINASRRAAEARFQQARGQYVDPETAAAWRAASQQKGTQVIDVTDE